MNSSQKTIGEHSRQKRWISVPVPRMWLETQLPSVLELVLFLLLFPEAPVIDYLLLDYMYGNNDDYHNHWYMDDEWGLDSQVFFFFITNAVPVTYLVVN